MAEQQLEKLGVLDFFSTASSTATWAAVTLPRTGQHLRLECVGVNTIDFSFEVNPDDPQSPTVHGTLEAGQVVDFPNRPRTVVRHQSASGATVKIYSW